MSAKPEPKTVDEIRRWLNGNVWINGQFQGSVAQDQVAAAIFGAFSRGPAVPR
jgi:hypothetical protein